MAPYNGENGATPEAALNEDSDVLISTDSQHSATRTRQPLTPRSPSCVPTSDGVVDAPNGAYTHSGNFHETQVDSLGPSSSTRRASREATNPAGVNEAQSNGTDIRHFDQPLAQPSSSDPHRGPAPSYSERNNAESALPGVLIEESGQLPLRCRKCYWKCECDCKCRCSLERQEGSPLPSADDSGRAATMSVRSSSPRGSVLVPIPIDMLERLELSGFPFRQNVAFSREYRDDIRSIPLNISDGSDINPINRSDSNGSTLPSSNRGPDSQEALMPQTVQCECPTYCGHDNRQTIQSRLDDLFMSPWKQLCLEEKWVIAVCGLTIAITIIICAALIQTAAKHQPLTQRRAIITGVLVVSTTMGVLLTASRRNYAEVSLTMTMTIVIGIFLTNNIEALS